MQTSSSTDMEVDAVGKDGTKGKSKRAWEKTRTTKETSATSVAARTCSKRLLVQRHERERKKGQAKRKGENRKATARTKTTKSRK